MWAPIEECRELQLAVDRREAHERPVLTEELDLHRVGPDLAPARDYVPRAA
jgi:hypothetical protein